MPESWHHERTEGTKSVSTLQMQVTSEHKGARISCKIWNRAMAEGEQLKVEANPLNVLYAPRVRVVPGFEEINVEEGETLPLVCHADANPQAAQYQWIHVPSGETHANKEWHLPIRRIHAGKTLFLGISTCLPLQVNSGALPPTHWIRARPGFA